MKQLTLPRAILIGSFLIALAILLKEDESVIVPKANAEVAGMDSYDLRYDYDFKHAVKSIVEDCDITGYVDDEYLYDTDISC